VNFPWAIRIAPEDAGTLGRLRLAAGVEVGETSEAIWLRGQQADEGLDARLAGLPAADRYEWVAPNQLRAIDQRIPTARLPAVSWEPLAKWLQIKTPTTALPGQSIAAAPLRLVRSSVEREPELLATSLSEFTQFASTAAQVRLERLQFAANAEGAVIVRGRPLPPLPGRRFVLQGGVAVPAGFAWQPAVSAEVLARRFGVSGEALILWSEDGTIARLHSEQFVTASRSAIRATQRALNEPP
jgi:hypothetical protein